MSTIRFQDIPIKAWDASLVTGKCIIGTKPGRVVVKMVIIKDFKWTELRRRWQIWLGVLFTLGYSKLLMEIAIPLYQNYDINLYPILWYAIQVWAIVGLVMWGISRTVKKC